MRTERFETAGEVSLAVQVPVGEIHVDTVEGSETTVELAPLNDAGRTAVEEARIEHLDRPGGSEVTVSIDEGRRVFLRRGPSLRVRVSCPIRTRVTLRTVSADVRVRGEVGDAFVQSVSGDAELEDVNGDLELRTVSGDADVRRVGGGTTLHTVSGDVVVRETASSVGARTVSGDLLLARVSEGEVRAQSVSGDMRIGVAPGARVFVDAKSLSGDMRSDLDLRDAPSGGDGRPLELHLKSVSGDVRIVRA